MQRTEWLLVCFHGPEHFLLIVRRIERLAAYLAPNNIHRNHIIPLPDQQMLKLDGFLRTDPPALTTAGAFGHIVPQRSPIVLIIIT